MQRHGLDALVATSPENLVYLVGYEAQQGTYSRSVKLAVVPADESLPVTLVTPAGEVGWIVDEDVDTRAEVVLFGGLGTGTERVPDLDSAERRILGLLDRPRLPDPWTGALLALESVSNKGRVAVEGPAGDALAVLKSRGPGHEFELGGDELLRLARMVKTADEVASIRRAVAVNDAAILSALSTAAVEDEAAMACAYRAGLAQAGALFQHWIGSTGRRTGMFRRPGGARPQIGDRIRYDAGMSLDGWCSDLGGTAQLGAEPSAEERANYAAITAGIDTAVALARPGRRPSEIYPAVVNAIRKAGITEYAFPLIGHGIGVEQRDLPIIAAAAPATMRYGPTPFDPELEPGMVINFETPWSEIGVGGYQHEVTVLVTDGGCEFLSGRRDYRVV
jgi:Xaa-Pro dipeptidase